ncbi:MAG: ABC transporter substrate-binding protein [Aristaeellaceae bacterium]
MKRTLAVLVTLMMLTGMLASTGIAIAEEPVTITVLTRYIENGPDAMNQFYYERMRQFDEENEDIVIEDISVNELDVYNQRLKSSIASNEFPDVFMNYGYSNISEWVENGLVRDLSDLISAGDYTGPSNDSYLMPWNYTSKGIEGVYGIPTNVNVGMVFYINKKMLDSFGLDVPKTWEDVYAIAPTLIENDIIPIALSAGTKGRLAHFHTALAMRMFGLEVRDKLVSGQIKWSEGESMEVLNKYEEMISMGLFGSDAISMDASGMQAAFLNGQAAMYPGMLVNSTATLAAAEEEGDYVMSNFFYFEDKPEYKDLWFVAAGDGLSIMTPEKETARLEAAKRFITYMTSQENFDEQARKNGANAFPVPVDYSTLGVEISPVLSDFFDSYNQLTGGSDEFDVYFDFRSSQEIFRTEIQTMFAGVDAASVAASLDAQYDAAQR